MSEFMRLNGIFESRLDGNCFTKAARGERNGIRKVCTKVSIEKSHGDPSYSFGHCTDGFIALFGLAKVKWKRECKKLLDNVLLIVLSLWFLSKVASEFRKIPGRGEEKLIER